MKLKLLLAWAPLFLLGACSFKSEDNAGTNPNVPTVTELKIDPNGDSDGDMMNNSEEINKGRNPFVADIPEIKMQFMKDFKMNYSINNNNLQVDSVRDIRGRSFEYRLGELSINKIAKKTTAHFARYDGVVLGDYKDIDLTRVSYPYISPKYIAELSFNHEVGEITSVNMSFTNTLKLERNKGFQDVSNPIFNFHMFNYETGEYDLISQQKLNKSVYEGVLEKFDVNLSELPAKLLKENFLQYGELLTAEIEDYDIPSLNTTYKKLMSSVLEKCVPITIITPNGTTVKYITLNDSNNRLGQFLKHLYGDDFKVENNSLMQAEGLVNNLPKYVLLSELTSNTKNGKWFILTNDRINDDVFQYHFKKTDKVVLNYMTGDELSAQVQKQGIVSIKNISSDKYQKDIEIGEVGQNDELQIELMSKRITTDVLKEIQWGFQDSVGNHSWIFWYADQTNEPFSFVEPRIKSRVSLVLNGTEYPLTKLIDDKVATILINENSLKISINSISKVFSLNSDESFNLALRIQPDNYQQESGLWVTALGGWWASQPGCGSADSVCRNYARSGGIPVDRICNRITGGIMDACQGSLKDEYRRQTKTLQRDMHFDASFLLVNKYN